MTKGLEFDEFATTKMEGHPISRSTMINDPHDPHGGGSNQYLAMDAIVVYRASNQLAPTAVFFDTIPRRQIFVTAEIQQGSAP